MVLVETASPASQVDADEVEEMSERVVALTRADRPSLVLSQWQSFGGTGEGAKPFDRSAASQLSLPNERIFNRRSASMSLSLREGQILSLIADGRTDKQIAIELCISINTVSTHIHRVFRKLGVHTRGAAIARLVQGDSVAGLRTRDR